MNLIIPNVLVHSFQLIISINSKVIVTTYYNYLNTVTLQKLQT
jgi:hypothetical protein